MKKTGGVPTLDVLAGLCPAIIAALPFAKRMRWGDGEFAFARPIRWVLALLGDVVVPFEVGKVQSVCGSRRRQEKWQSEDSGCS